MLGVDVNGLHDFEEHALRQVLAKQKAIRMTELQILVTAIFDAAEFTATGKSGGKVNDHFRRLRNLLFPQIAEDLRGKAEKTQKLLKKEFEGGPFKVQGLDYGGKKRKKGR